MDGTASVLPRLEAALAPWAVFEILLLDDTRSLVLCGVLPHIGSQALGLAIAGDAGSWSITIDDHTRRETAGTGADEALEQFVWAAAFGAQRWEWRSREYWVLGDAPARARAGRLLEERAPWGPDIRTAAPRNLFPLDPSWCTARRSRRAIS